MINLTNKVALITGGSRGIGSACVKLFARANCNIAFTYNKHKDRANIITETIASEKAQLKIKSYKCNIEKENDIISTVQEVQADFGKIDFLINNAGIWKYGESDKMTLTQWEEMLKVNMTSTFLFCREVIPSMKRNRFGRIINISSTAGQRGEAFHSHYAASKGAMISFTKSLSSELASFNILVNSVAPGWVDTEMCDEVFSDLNYKEQVRNSIPIGRIPAPEDIAGPVLFLASDLAKHITGEILNVNGGSVLCG